MLDHVTAGASTSIFRLDKFSVPVDSLPAFLERLRITQQTLSAFSGCKQNLVLTKMNGTSRFNIVTLVEWESADAIAAATAGVRKKYADEGFDPTAFMQSLGVEADMGSYEAA